MLHLPRLHRLVLVPLIAVLLLTVPAATAFAHARFDYAEPAAGSVLDGSPFVLRVWFTQELMLRSTIVVVDAAGAQVDLGDGRVDQDDPNRKSMLVSLPELPTGVYTVQYTAWSADDDHEEVGSFAFGVGVAPAGEGPPAPTEASPTGGY